MEIHKEWEQLNQKKYSNQSLKTGEILNAITSESSSALHQINRGLIIKSHWALGFIIIFSIIMILSKETLQAVITLGIVNLIYIIGFLTIKLEAKRINTGLSDKGNILECLKSNARIIKRAFYFEMTLFVFSSPLITLCSMVYINLINGHTYDTLLHNSSFLIAAIIMCTINTPLVYFFGKKLNKKYFASYLKKFNDNIQKLEGIEMINSMIK